MIPIVYDTAALLAAERYDPWMTAQHKRAKQTDRKPLVPLVVLAQAWRGGPQKRLVEVLAGCEIVFGDKEIGREAGRTCASAGTTDVVDAIVVATATACGAVVITSDPKDLKELADCAGKRLQMQVV